MGMGVGMFYSCVRDLVAAGSTDWDGLGIESEWLDPLRQGMCPSGRFSEHGLGTLCSGGRAQIGVQGCFWLGAH